MNYFYVFNFEFYLCKYNLIDENNSNNISKNLNNKFRYLKK